jgi:hypothetical protein
MFVLENNGRMTISTTPKGQKTWRVIRIFNVIDLVFNGKAAQFKIENDPTSGKTMKKYHAKCSNCNKLMNEGYVINGGQEYYCSNKCLNIHITKKKWLEMYDNGNRDSYWTEWTEDEDMYYWENGEEIEEDFVKSVNEVHRGTNN